MSAARIRTAGVPRPAFRLMLIVLVAACGGQGALAQTGVPGGSRIVDSLLICMATLRVPISDSRI